MRIVGGIAGSIRLKTLPGAAVRPTTDRVKESLFGILGDLRDAKVLDLYAGNGALGLEALSRGAERVVLIERQSRHVQVIEENRRAVCRSVGADAEARVRVIRGDVRLVPKMLPELASAFDVILADPPYRPDPGDYGAAELLQDPAFQAWAGPQATLVLEHAADTPLPWHPLSPWRLREQRRYGNIVISFARLAEPSPSPA